MVQPFCKRIWQLLIILTILLPHTSAIVLLIIYPNELKSYVHTKPYVGLIGASFLIAKTWKQPICPSVGR